MGLREELIARRDEAAAEMLNSIRRDRRKHTEIGIRLFKKLTGREPDEINADDGTWTCDGLVFTYHVEDQHYELRVLLECPTGLIGAICEGCAPRQAWSPPTSSAENLGEYLANPIRYVNCPYLCQKEDKLQQLGRLLREILEDTKD